ncbi:hypothetical protein D9M68_589060 [compost metagenome]
MVASGFAANGWGQAKIQQGKPGLKHGEKAHQAVGFRPHIFDIQGQDQDTHGGDINLARVIRQDIVI